MVNNEIVYLLCLLNVGLVFVFLFEIKKLKEDYKASIDELESSLKEEYQIFRADIKSGLGERKIKYNNTVVFDCLEFKTEGFKTACYIEANLADKQKIAVAKQQMGSVYDFERALIKENIDYRIISVHKLN